MADTYLYVRVPGCPIEPPSGGPFPLHRLVLYAKIGPGPHPCFRCEEPVDWNHDRTAPGALTVNHLDRDKRNNAWDNLVPSCHSCNLEHGKDPRFQEGPVMIIGGKRNRAELRTCETCGEQFLVRVSALRSAERRGKIVGRFCSQKCLYGRDWSKDKPRRR